MLLYSLPVLISQLAKSMQRFMSISEVSPIRRALASLRLQTKERWNLFKHMRFISKQDILYNQIAQAHKYSDQLSYCYRLYDFTTPHSLHHFSFYNDSNIGGQSKGKLVFDQQEKCLVIQGAISDKDKEKLVQHPSIGMARTHPYSIRCGPFNAISIQLDTDGHPIHFGVEVQSKISGVVTSYGIITSKTKGWRTYEIPFMNMILVGAEESQQWNNGEQELNMTSKDGTRLGENRTDMRRIIQTETEEVVMHDINLRLLSSKSVERKVGIRSINLVRRAGSQKFIRDYLHPYFYMVDEDPYLLQKDIGVSWLSKGYSNFKSIDLGDKKYVKKQGQVKRSN